MLRQKDPSRKLHRKTMPGALTYGSGGNVQVQWENSFNLLDLSVNVNSKCMCVCDIHKYTPIYPYVCISGYIEIYRMFNRDLCN